MSTSVSRAAASAADIAQAARVLDAGGLIGLPTETVYGLAADAENPEAVQRIYAAKQRPAGHPIIAHIAPDADPGYWVSVLPPLAQRLMDAFWPGPLTLILKRHPRIDAAISGGQDSIGLRCPSHPVAQALLREFAALRGGHAGVGAPSANRFGHVSPTLAAHVRAEFPQEVADGMPVLEGGQAEVGIESTILDVSRLDTVGPVLLRPGIISAQRLAEVIGALPAAPDAHAPRASGTLKAHYAPNTLLHELPEAALLVQAQGTGLRDAERVAVIAYCAAPAALDTRVQWHAIGADPVRYAHDLYALLREVDAGGFDRILLQQPPASAEWAAINDRVGRAAAAFGD